MVCRIKPKKGDVPGRRLIIDFSEKRAEKDNFSREKLIKYLIVENQGKVAGIDQQKIEQDKRHDGLKGYWTNLQAKTKSKEIIDQYHNLWKVEKAFRMSKSDLQERPIFHRRIKRINGHLLICFCSLLILKETERMLKPTEISLMKAIEILGKVEQGEMILGKLKLPIDSELSEEAKSIFHEVLGH